MKALLDFLDGFYKIGPAARAALLGNIREQQFGKDELVQDIGNTCRTLYFVKAGGARIFYYKNGNDITEHFAFEHELIVRVESLFTGQPTMKGIATVERTTLFAIDAPALFQLYDDYRDIERLFRLIFEREFVQAIKRLESLQFQTATERYTDLLQTTDLVQKIPLKHIASYLGITQVSLSRIRSSLR